MANDNPRINDVLDEQAVNTQIDYLINRFGEVEKRIRSINENGIQIELQLKGNNDKTLADLVGLTKQLKDSNEALSASTLELAQIRELNAKATLNEAKADQIKSKSSTQASKDAATLSNDYKLLTLAYKDAYDKYRNYALVLGATHPLTLQAAEDASKLLNVQKNLGFAIGDFTKNVGNYNSVQGQTNQLLRELPNLAQSPQIFIQSLSNNITYFAEAIKKAREEGQSWKDIMGNISAGFTGLVGIVNIAVTAFIFLSNAVLKSGNSAKKATDDYRELADGIEAAVDAQSKYEQGLADSADVGVAAAKRQLEQAQARSQGTKKDLKDIADAEQNLYKKQKEVNDYKISMYKELQSVVNGLKGSTNEEGNKIFSTNATQIRDALLNIPTRYKEQFVKEIQEANKKGLDLTDEFTQKMSDLDEKNKDLENDRIVSQLREKAKANKIHYDDTTAMERRLRDAITASDLERQKASIETDKKTQEAIIQNEQTSLDDQLAARWQFHNDELAIIELEKTAEINKNNDLHKANLAEINKSKTTTENRNKLLVLENERYQKEQLAITEKYAELQLQSLGKYADEGVKDVEKATDKTSKLIKDNLKAMQGYFSQGIHAGQYQTRKQFEDLQAKALQTAATIFKAFSDIGKSIGDAVFDKKIQELNTIQQQLQDNYNMQIAQIDATATSEIDAINKKGEAAARYEAARQEAARRERELQRQKAQFDKSVTISQIITSTALAVMAALGAKPYTPANIALAAAAGATGAAQLAAAIAAPIPQYYKGIDSSPEGIAWVGERGRELKITPDGGISLTPNSATLDYLQKGTTIIPAHETRQILDAIPYSLLGGLLLPEHKQRNDKMLARVYEEATAQSADRIINELRKGRGHTDRNTEFFKSSYYQNLKH